MQPTHADVLAAHARIAAAIRETPLLPIDARSTGPDAPAVWAKAESLQRTRSFKLRGAMNFVASLDEETRARGVVTHSSGNHGQALACAAARYGIPATVVIPEGAPAIKVARTEAWGARVLRCENNGAARAEVAEQAVQETGGTLVPPYDHPWIIVGQGTMGLEIAAQRPDVANVLVCVGGGGLAAGTVLAMREKAPHAKVIGVEPELAADAKESLGTGTRVAWSAERTTSTMADGVRTQQLGEVPFPILMEGLDGIVTVPEAAIENAARWWLREGGLAVEPTGALSLGAWWRLLENDGSVDGVTLNDGPTVLVVSGGNVDPGWLAGLLT